MNSKNALVIFCPTDVGGVRNVTQNIANAMANYYEYTHIESTVVAVIWRAIMLKRKGISVYGLLSLHSCLASPFLHKSVYILHGYPVKPHYGILRTWALVLAPKYSAFFGSKVVAVSHLTRNVFQRIHGLPVDKVIYNGCDPQFHEDCNVEKSKKKQILYIGRLDHNKGILELIDAFRRISSDIPDYKLKIAGNGPLFKSVFEAAKSNPNIIFLGQVSDTQKLDLFRSAEVFISLNDFEPMGVVYTEAMLAGCKIVYPYACGAGDFIPTYYPQRKCDPRLIDDLSQSLLSALEDEAEAKLQPNDIKRFDYRNIAKNYYELFAE